MHILNFSTKDACETTKQTTHHVINCCFVVGYHAWVVLQSVQIAINDSSGNKRSFPNAVKAGRRGLLKFAKATLPSLKMQS